MDLKDTHSGKISLSPAIQRYSSYSMFENSIVQQIVLDIVNRFQNIPDYLFVSGIHEFENIKYISKIQGVAISIDHRTCRFLLVADCLHWKLKFHHFISATILPQQVRYDNELGRVVYEPVEVSQEFRNFETNTPQGLFPNYQEDRKH